MEMGKEDASTMFGATRTVSWPIVHGSVDDAVTYESSLSAADSDSATLICRKPPLVLRRSPSVSTPCEITVSFEQQHEVRQVYIRSSARVYEIYYKAKSQSDNEYLCTVRCCMAADSEEVPEVTKVEGIMKSRDVGESNDSSSSMSNGPVDAVKSIADSGSSASEDGWVEVKVSDSPPSDNGGMPVLGKTEICLERGTQDFYEATAEISDADPCVSLTLRLLSIQSREYVYIDEVYIFADPVVSDDTSLPVSRVESSLGNSLMSMLVPTILQLSKSQISHIEDKHDSDEAERRMYASVEKQPSASATTSSKIVAGDVEPQKLMLEKLSGPSSQVPLLESSTQPLDTDDKKKHDSTSEINDSPSSHIERTLDQLVNRLARVEDLCLRLEEGLVKPITRMESRIDRIEQQLELLTKNSHCSSTALWTRISAPGFSCHESESNSYYNDGNTCIGVGVAGSTEPSSKGDLPFDEPSVLSCHTHSPVHTSQLLPSLVVTAPEFCSMDDEEEPNDVEPFEESPRDEVKKPMSINDALASALAGFLSSCSTQPAVSTRITEATHISNKQSSNAAAASVVLDDGLVIPSPLQNGSTEIVTVESSAITSNEDFANGSDQKSHVAIDDSTETIGNSDVQDPILEDSANICFEYSDDSQSVQDAKGSTTICNCTEDRAETERSRTCICDNIGTPVLPCGSQSNNTSDALSEANDSIPGKTFTEEGSDILLNFLKLSGPSVVDFRIPILDVEFQSQGTSVGISPIEALFGENRELNSDVRCIQEGEASMESERNHLVLVEDEESVGHPTVDCQLVDFDCCGSETGEMPLDKSEEMLQFSLICSSGDSFPTLI